MNESLDKLHKAWLEYHSAFRDNKELRFGQYFINNFVVGSCPQIYYEKNEQLAYQMLYEEISGGNLQLK